MEKKQVDQIIAQMTIEEKASLCVGGDFWHIKGIERLNIPSVMMTDGPHGLRKQVMANDHLGLSESKAAICFPAGCALASSFEPENAKKLGTELGKLAKAEEVSMILGPAMNIKRSPLCGRNFEYYSEDPFVSSNIGAAAVKGIQSQKVGACPKHYLANNQEYFRQTSNSVVNEQTMREIYLASFENMVKEAKPWAMMCSYNKINGTYASENKKYLTDILRNEWGFEGYVMTDWGACDDPVDSLAAGLDLEMPGPAPDNVRRIMEAVCNGKLDEVLLDQAVERILSAVFKYTENVDAKTDYDFEEGHQAARMIEAESAVLLKNDENILPIKEGEKVTFIGKYVKEPRYQGGGSSHIHPYRVSCMWDTVKNMKGVLYAEGYGEKENEALLIEAVQTAKKADKVIIFAGLPDARETEGIDRSSLDMPRCQNRLITEVSKVQPNTVVVLHNGSPVSMPWLSSVKAVLEMYLGGEAVGLAAYDLLYGKINPSGRLAETFPLRVEDTPTFPYYGIERDDVIYREERFVGYRYYETMKKKVLFPFGYGMSYTKFTYTDLTLSRGEIKDDEQLEVRVDVTNEGNMEGKEVVQLYVQNNISKAIRPLRELRGFQKVFIRPGETKTVSFVLNKRAFAEWNIENHDWHVPTGMYGIQIGSSAADIILEQKVMVISSNNMKPHFTINTPVGDIMNNPAARKVFIQKMGSRTEKENTESAEENEDILSKSAMEATAAAMPLRAMLSFDPEVKSEQLEQLIADINKEMEVREEV